MVVVQLRLGDLSGLVEGRVPFGRFFSLLSFDRVMLDYDRVVWIDKVLILDLLASFARFDRIWNICTYHLSQITWLHAKINLLLPTHRLNRHLLPRTQLAKPLILLILQRPHTLFHLRHLMLPTRVDFITGLHPVFCSRLLAFLGYLVEF